MNIKKFLVGTVASILMLGVTVVPAFAVNTVSFGTIGTGATAIPIGTAVELYTPDGAAGYAYIRLDIPGGIALNAINSLLYDSKVITSGVGGFAPEVILNIDADNDGVLVGIGMDWMFSSHSAASIGADNFLSGDNWPTSAGSPDVSFINRDALTGYNYWSADDPRTGFASYWAPFSTILGSSLPAYSIDATDKVYSIDFVVGTSGNFNGMKAQFNSVELNGITYPVIPPLVGPPTDKNQCKDNGWKTFNNPAFRNQGQCVSYVQSNDHAGKRQ